MERQIVSTSNLLLKFLWTITSGVFLFLDLMVFNAGIQKGWAIINFAIIFGTVLVAFFMLRFLFNKQHPVYFDERNIYWQKRGVEYVIPFEHIRDFSLYSYGRAGLSKTGWISYMDDMKDEKKFGFFLMHGWSNNSFVAIDMDELLVNLQRLIRLRNPDFVIHQYKDLLGLSEGDDIGANS
jgi:hypothetical protein